MELRKLLPLTIMQLALSSIFLPTIFAACQIEIGTTLSKPWQCKIPAGRLVFQNDGNLVVYSTKEEAKWASNTAGRGHSATFQTDGNFIIRNARGQSIFASDTADKGVTSMEFGEDRNLVISSSTSIFWQSDTRVNELARPVLFGSPRPSEIPRITVDTSAAPEMAAFGEKVKATMEKWFGLLEEILRTNEYNRVASINIRFDPNHDASKSIAYAMNGEIVAAVSYFKDNQHDVGSMIHEMTHILQGYPMNCGWVTEGIADYVEHYICDEGMMPARPPSSVSYTSGYRNAAYLFHYLDLSLGDQYKIWWWAHKDCRAGNWNSDAFWHRVTGKTVDEWWQEITNTSTPLPSRSGSNSIRTAEQRTHQPGQTNTSQTVWNVVGDSKWAHNCEFIGGGTIGSQASTAEQCGGICWNTGGCTHFTWTNKNGGSCHLKTYEVSYMELTAGAICGSVRISQPEVLAGWNVAGNVRWNSNCNFVGGDIANVGSRGEECGGLCENRIGCTHFTWRDTNGGICYMKGAGVNSVAAMDKVGTVVCGWINA